jgi:hypothetical protein
VLGIEVPSGIISIAGEVIEYNALSHTPMSAFGPKWTSLVAPHMSAFEGQRGHRAAIP